MQSASSKIWTRVTVSIFYNDNHYTMGISFKTCKLTSKLSKLANHRQGQPKALFSTATTPRCWGGCHSFPWIAPLSFHLYLIILSVKQVDIRYHFLRFWYDSTWDWKLVFLTIKEHSNYYANGLVYIYIYIYIYIYFINSCPDLHLHISTDMWSCDTEGDWR